jgi:Flp pilus assembly protein TadD
VLEIDPHTPVVLAEVGRFRLGQGDAADAGALLERALAPGQGEPDWWTALGQARQETGDDLGAAEAYGKALSLDPEQEEASAGLAVLAAGS